MGIALRKNKDKTCIIYHDKGGVYEDNTVISAKSLVQDYIDGLNSVEDKDTIEWMENAIKLISYDDVIAFIGGAWEMEVEMK